MASLEPCRSLSEGADKLYKMCRLFLQIARFYLQAKQQDSATQSQSYAAGARNYYTTTDGTQLDLNAMSSFNPYLSALGLMPNEAWPSESFAGLSGGLNPYLQGQAGVVNPGADFPGMGSSGGSQNLTQDWFSGSRYLMNMMEAGDDLVMPDLDL